VATVANDCDSEISNGLLAAWLSMSVGYCSGGMCSMDDGEQARMF